MLRDKIQDMKLDKTIAAVLCVYKVVQHRNVYRSLKRLLRKSKAVLELR